jgi:hypothetical protein
MGFYGLRCVFRYHLCTKIVLCVGLSATHISYGFVGLQFEVIKHYSKCNGGPGLCLRLVL